MKNIIRITSFLLISYVLVSKSQADEFIKLTNNLGPSKYIVLEATNSDFEGNPTSPEFIHKIRDYSRSEADKITKTKISIYKLSDGEAIELTKPIFTAWGGEPEKPKEYPDEGTAGWTWGNYNYYDAYSVFGTDGNVSTLSVRFPESEKWHSLEWSGSRGFWEGLGSNNPMIIGPCEIKLESNARIYLDYYHPYRDSHDPKTKYALRYYGFNSWLFAKKINLGSSSSATTTAQSLVLPEGSGDLTIIMEGSNDLINWTREDLGKKPEANRKTFYRIRAVKE